MPNVKNSVIRDIEGEWRGGLEGARIRDVESTAAVDNMFLAEEYITLPLRTLTDHDCAQ